MKTLKLAAASYTVRSESFNGKSYLVAPVTALVEGVHTGMDGIPTLYLAADILASASLWENAPLTTPMHPLKDGKPVSITEPGIREAWQVGLFRNVSGENGKLSGEAWFEIEATQRIYPALIEKLQNGEAIEVSTGLFADEITTEGVFNAEPYQAQVSNFQPDHLAILPSDTGACSVSDGCGVRANRKKNIEEIPMSKIKHFLSNMVDRLFGNETSHGDIADKLYQFVNSLDGPEYINYLKDIYDNYFVYETVKRDNMTGVTVAAKLYKRSYSTNESGEVTIADDSTEVVEEKTYTPITNESPVPKINIEPQPEPIKESKMKDELIVNLISSGRFSEEAKPQLELLSECFLKKLSEEKLATVETPIVNAEPAPEPKKPTFDELYALASAEDKAAIDRARTADKEAKDKLVAAILANKANKFSTEALNAKDITELESIHALATVSPTHDYTAAPGAPIDNAGKMPLPPRVTMPKESK